MNMGRGRKAIVQIVEDTERILVANRKKITKFI